MKTSWHSQFKRSPKEARTFRGMTFDSLSEMRMYRNLLMRQEAGEIKNLKRQVSYDLILPNGVPIRTPTGRTAKYTDDAEYDDCKTGNHIILDHKGYIDKQSQFRIAVFEAIYGVKVIIVK